MGTINQKYWVVCLGRFLFGTGGETMSINESIWLANWFQGSKYLTFVFGLDESLGRVGGLWNSSTTPHTAKVKGLNYVMGFGFFICCIGMIGAVILCAIEIYNNRRT